MEYYLYPPFFMVPEEHSFDDAWEVFCCKMLNLSEARTDIYRRTPPESGIDLYCPGTTTAYQCKSVETGRAGAFNTTKAVESIKAAKNARTTLPWDKYVICTNVDVTGTAEEKLRAEEPNIEIRSRSFWVGACERCSDAAEPHFRHLITIPRRRTEEALREGFVAHYCEQLRELIEQAPVEIFLYSNRHEKIYRVPVSLDFKIDDLLHIFRAFFQLPGPRTFNGPGINISLRHSVVVDGKKQTFGRSLRECGIAEHTIVTYWTTMVWEEAHEKAEVGYMNLEHAMGGGAWREEVNPRQEAFDEYKRLVSTSFARFDASLETEPHGA